MGSISTPSCDRFRSPLNVYIAGFCFVATCIFIYEIVHAGVTDGAWVLGLAVWSIPVAIFAFATFRFLSIGVQFDAEHVVIVNMTRRYVLECGAAKKFLPRTDERVQIYNCGAVLLTDGSVLSVTSITSARTRGSRRSEEELVLTINARLEECQKKRT